MAKITVYDIPENTHATFKKVAEKAHRSLSGQVQYMIDMAVAEYERAEKERPVRGLQITEDVMRSSSTPHYATCIGPGSWVVSWLPNRTLTQGQAVTAMTIAEVLGNHDQISDPVMADHRLWGFLDNWAQELGLTGPAAVAEASRDPEDFRNEEGK